ncbi:aminotransferase class I/II-fold pyridoxal phosphate-dependent enzyme, partial [Acinetobacter baumannii]
TLLSHRIQETLRPSATLMMGQRAAALRAEGKDVLNLAMGEPDFDTPEFIKVAAFEALKAGFTKYTAVEGLLPLRQAIAQKLKIDQGIDYT